MNKRLNFCQKFLLALISLWVLPGALAAQDYTPKGADTCLMCHRAGQSAVMPIFDTRHGSRTDPNAPWSGLQCESCHGPSNDHVKGKMSGQSVQPARTFGDGDEASVSDQNGACLSCHKDHEDVGWFGSAHERTDVACVSCHSIHQQRDPVFDPVAQQETCFTCHPRTRSDVHKASGHPLRQGQMTCSDCHDVHDGNSDFLLNGDDINDNCYSCHAEKRGPFLWAHAPATEECTLCHQPHGSNHPAMLTRRPPLLCQQCHSASGHPSVAYGADDIDDGTNNRFLLAKSCTNCHSQVHGSNHPSGASRIR